LTITETMGRNERLQWWTENTKDRNETRREQIEIGNAVDAMFAPWL